MAVDGTLIFDTKIDESGFNRGTANIKSSVSGLSGMFGKIGAAVAGAFAVKKLIDFGKQAVQLASDVDEVQNVVDTAFGSMKNKMEEFADTAIETYGISKLAAKQTGSTYMAMARGMGIASESASDMSVRLTGLSADMASFYNAEQNVTAHALNSIFTGETEALKKYGIVMTEANLTAFAMSQGIARSYKEMSQAEKVQLRYQYVLNQTALAQGDFARTSNGWANQTRILSEQWKEFAATVGDILKNVLLPVIRMINNALSYLIKAVKWARDILAELFGWEKSSNEVVEDTSDLYGEIAENAEDTAKSVERQLMGFDKINKLSSSSISSSISISSPSIKSSEIANINKASKATSFFSGVLSKLKEKLSPIIKALKELWIRVKPFAKQIGEGLKWFWDNVITPLANWAVENFIPAAIDLISAAIELLGQIIEAASPFLKWIWDNFFKPLLEFTWQLIIDFIESLTKVFKKLSDWARENPEAMRTIADIVLGFLAGLWVYNSTKMIIGFLGGLIDKLREFGGLSGLMSAIGSALMSPAVAIGALTTAALYWVQNWSDIKSAFEGMSGWERAITVVMGLALAVAVLWTAISVGVAAAGIVAGLGVLGLGKWILSRGTSSSDKLNSMAVGALSPSTASQSVSSIPSGNDAIKRTIHPIKVGEYEIPKYATGTVIPAHYGEFLGMLGDNKREPEVVSPLSTIKKAVKEVMGENGGGDITLIVKLNEDVLYETVVRKHQQNMIKTGVDDFA